MGQIMLILYIFDILAHFFFSFMVNYPFEKRSYVHFLRRRGSEKVDVLSLL